MVPELVDPRYTRSMDIRDPISISDAQKKVNQNNKINSKSIASKVLLIDSSPD